MRAGWVRAVSTRLASPMAIASLYLHHLVVVAPRGGRFLALAHTIVEDLCWWHAILAGDAVLRTTRIRGIAAVVATLVAFTLLDPRLVVVIAIAPACILTIARAVVPLLEEGGARMARDTARLASWHRTIATALAARVAHTRVNLHRLCVVAA